MANKKRNAAAVGAVVAGLGLIGTEAQAVPDWAKNLSEVEKCKGVAQKGMNDCGTKDHNCAGKAKADNLPDEWVYVPKGVCKKIGGEVKAVKKIES